MKSYKTQLGLKQLRFAHRWLHPMLVVVLLGPSTSRREYHLVALSLTPGYVNLKTLLVEMHTADRLLGLHALCTMLKKHIQMVPMFGIGRIHILMVLGQ
mmetsp:Transcript_26867/g.36235  ORF Transcript_26867/g.36235 Transcript_26867/m.36235 type:complete len:99 (-) Transcript_26867:54-350(-)